MKSGAVALVGVLLGVGIAAAGVALGGPKPGVSISGNYTPAGDSVNIRVTVTSKDAQGQSVSQFAVEWLLEGVQVATVSVPGALSVTLVRTFKAPLAGDTAIYSACATATDRRGQTSRGCSGLLRVLGPPWTPPTPPTITIDTVAYEPGHPDGLELYIQPPTWGGRVVMNGETLVAAPGDTVTWCALMWDGGYLRTPTEVVQWRTDRPSAVAFNVTASNCVLVTALIETGLGIVNRYPLGLP